MRTRVGLMLAGLAAAAYGLLRLLELGWANTWAAVVWLVGGVVLHDAVFAPLVLGVALLAVRVVPRERLAPFVVALVVLVPVTLLSIPELGRFGARADRPTLLDRHYWPGWWAMVALVVVSVAVGTYAGRRRTSPGRREDDPTDG
jgi:hypothetical protein